MTRDDIFRMAREAGAKPSHNPELWDIWNIRDTDLERFAKLVAEREREECAKVCDLALIQCQEAMNELDETEQIARCFLQGAMNQLVKLSKAIRAKGEK